MNADNDYLSTLRHLWEKSLILHDTSLFNKTLYFYFLDSLAHIDYTCSIYAFNYQSPKNIIGGEYMRWRIDEEKKGDRAKFPAFIAWLKEEHPEKFATLPSLWQMLYDPRGPGGVPQFPDRARPGQPPADTARSPCCHYRGIFRPGLLKEPVRGCIPLNTLYDLS